MLAAALGGAAPQPLAAALSPARFAVDGSLRPPARLAEREHSRALLAVMPWARPEGGFG
jgi:hypothetical protein